MPRAEDARLRAGIVRPTRRGVVRETPEETREEFPRGRGGRGGRGGRVGTTRGREISLTRREGAPLARDRRRRATRVFVIFYRPTRLTPPAPSRPSRPSTRRRRFSFFSALSPRRGFRRLPAPFWSSRGFASRAGSVPTRPRRTRFRPPRSPLRRRSARDLAISNRRPRRRSTSRSRRWAPSAGEEEASRRRSPSRRSPREANPREANPREANPREAAVGLGSKDRFGSL